jgi:hypothetical protein
MTQEDKILLLKDLSARLPYGVKCQVQEDEYIYIGTLCRIEVDNKNGHLLDFVETISGLDCQVYLTEVKPYLFPLSSLTKEQRNIISNKIKEIQINNPPFGKIRDNGTDNLLNHITLCAQWLINYYDENHLDHRGLIEKGLANNAQNYPNVYNDYDK